MKNQTEGVPNIMVKLTIIYHSFSGNTEAMAKAICEGAYEMGATVNIKKIADATIDDILNCDAVIFGSPNYFNYMSGALKEFLDQAYIVLSQEDKAKSKYYAAFGSGGGQGEPATTSIEYVCNNFSTDGFCKFKFEKAVESIASNGKPSREILEKCKYLGEKITELLRLEGNSDKLP
jgi:multimeric flavodoxin WrbA